jgi:hypothetical protein
MPSCVCSLESKDTDRSGPNERTCWLLFRMSVLNQQQGGKHRYRDSYGRFAADSKSGDNTSLGWNDFMPVSEFLDPQLGYTVDDTAVFSASFHIIKESTTFARNLDRSSSVLKRSKSKVRRGSSSGLNPEIMPASASPCICATGLRVSASARCRASASECAGQRAWGRLLGAVCVAH